MLLEWVSTCKDLYGLAFYQWRHKYPYYRNYDFDTVNKLVLARTGFLIIEPLEDPKIEGDTGKGIEKITITESQISYYFDQEPEEPHNFLINSFERVGWADPFPKEPNSVS